MQSSQEINQLRQLQDFEDGMAAEGRCFIGRLEESIKYLKKYPKNMLNPWKRGETWSVEKNMAFMLGAIESGKEFLIISTLDNILDRAQRGLRGACADKTKLGYATAEILWLQDNGYTFRPSTSHSGLVIAVPPSKPPAMPIFKKYGRTFTNDARIQVNRIAALRDNMKQEEKRMQIQEEMRRQTSRSRRDYSVKYTNGFRFSSFTQGRRDYKIREARDNNRKNDVAPKISRVTY